MTAAAGKVRAAGMKEQCASRGRSGAAIGGNGPEGDVGSELVLEIIEQLALDLLIAERLDKGRAVHGVQLSFPFHVGEIALAVDIHLSYVSVVSEVIGGNRGQSAEFGAPVEMKLGTAM